MGRCVVIVVPALAFLSVEEVTVASCPKHDGCRRLGQ